VAKAGRLHQTPRATGGGGAVVGRQQPGSTCPATPARRWGAAGSGGPKQSRPRTAACTAVNASGKGGDGCRSGNFPSGDAWPRHCGGGSSSCNLEQTPTEDLKTAPYQSSSRVATRPLRARSVPRCSDATGLHHHPRRTRERDRPAPSPVPGRPPRVCRDGRLRARRPTSLLRRRQFAISPPRRSPGPSGWPVRTVHTVQLGSIKIRCTSSCVSSATAGVHRQDVTGSGARSLRPELRVVHLQCLFLGSVSVRALSGTVVDLSGEGGGGRL